MVIGQVTTQDVEVDLTLNGDVVVIVAAGQGGADHEQQDLGQRVSDAAHGAWVVGDGEVVQQHDKAGLVWR